MITSMHLNTFYSVWKQISPKLEACIKEEAKRRETVAREKRLRARQAELRVVYEGYIAELPQTYTEPLPAWHQLLKFDEVKHLLERGEGTVPVSQEDFASIVSSVLEKHAQAMTATLTEALEYAFPPYATKSEAGSDTQTTLNLDSVFAIFSCEYCYSGAKNHRDYSFSELKQHIREKHLMASYGHSAYNISASRKSTIRKILRMLNIPENARYDDVSKRVVCLCGKPSFQQPAEFSALVCFSALR